jgi:hypothetical protein
LGKLGLNPIACCFGDGTALMRQPLASDANDKCVRILWQSSSPHIFDGCIGRQRPVMGDQYFQHAPVRRELVHFPCRTSAVLFSVV